MTRLALVDCNNFFCSCERVFNPALMGKPIVVLSNNDGCIIFRREEAKAHELCKPDAIPLASLAIAAGTAGLRRVAMILLGCWDWESLLGANGEVAPAPTPWLPPSVPT